MKKNILVMIAVLAILTSCASGKKDQLVVIHTAFGDMKVLLYDETPLHKANFIELAESGAYDSTIFHRVIKEFMVQGGGIDMKNNDKTNKTIPAELNKGFYHHKGALAAARQGDQVNPTKASSWCQFYIVQGKTYPKEEMDAFDAQMNEGKKRNAFGTVIQRPEHKETLEFARKCQREGNTVALDSIMAMIVKIVDSEFISVAMTEQQKEMYTNIGGAPHLDNDYTVFGKVVEGLDVIDQIAAVQTAPGDKPLQDYFMTMEVVNVSKKEITEKYGYHYPEDSK